MGIGACYGAPFALPAGQAGLTFEVSEGAADLLKVLVMWKKKEYIVLFVPFLAGGLGVAFSLPFLVAILKREKVSIFKISRVRARKRMVQVIINAQ